MRRRPPGYRHAGGIDGIGRRQGENRLAADFIDKLDGLICGEIVGRGSAVDNHPETASSDGLGKIQGRLGEMSGRGPGPLVQDTELLYAPGC